MSLWNPQKRCGVMHWDQQGIPNEEMKLPENPHDIMKKLKCKDVDE